MLRKIPNTITLGNAVCGILAILLGNPTIGAYLILAAMILDLLDGLTARALNVKSDLGEQLDSLADMVSFGVAPAFLYYSIFNNTEALLASIFYILSALYRLAKFNTESYMKDFNGLPSPAAAGILSGAILLYASDAASSPDWLPIAAIIAPAICMNIHMGFFSLKEGRVIKDWKLWFVVIATAWSFTVHWHYALFVCFASYLFVSFVSGVARNVGGANS